MYQLSDKAKQIKPYIPVTAQHKIHLDANESFVPLAASTRERIAKEAAAMAINRYPDPTAEAACCAFAKLYGVKRELVVAGNGSDELISVIFSVFLQKGEAFATIEPDFSMYGFYGQLCEGQHVEIKKNKNLVIDIDNVIETCNNKSIKLLIFSNPCNPTSLGLCAEAVLQIIRAVDALVVLDEAYMDFWDQSLLPQIEDYDNLVILRTCSKALGAAGLRLGFAVANPTLAGILQAAKSPYNVSAVTQLMGAALLREPDEIQKALGTILASKMQLEKALCSLAQRSGRFQLVMGHTNFVTLLMAEPKAFYEALLSMGIVVRLTAGLIRVTCGTELENQTFLHSAENYFMGGA